MVGKLGLRAIPVTSHSQETPKEGTQSLILFTGKLYLFKDRIPLNMDYLYLIFVSVLCGVREWCCETCVAVSRCDGLARASVA